MRWFPSAVVLTISAFLIASTARAAPIIYSADLSGPAESPPNASPGTGFATVIFDLAAHSLEVDVTFSGLIGTTTNSHIHCCTAVPETGTAGVATQVPTFLNLPLGVTSGSFTQTLDTSLSGSWNPAFVTANGGVAGAEAALAAGLAAKEAYLNIHTTAFPTGEIRGFLEVPEPATLLLLGGGVLGLAGWRKRPRAA